MATSLTEIDVQGPRLNLADERPAIHPEQGWISRCGGFVATAAPTLSEAQSQIGDRGLSPCE